jgi:general secretion pathway protein G
VRAGEKQLFQPIQVWKLLLNEEVALMRNRGFSLIELMIVVAIIGILVAVALPQFASMSDDAKQAKAKQDIDVIVGALTRYNAMEPRKADGLSDLKGKYMVKLPVDPWGADYFLDQSSGVIGSPGGDGKAGTRDDISISYLPDPILMDVKFLDVGAPRVCLPVYNPTTDKWTIAYDDAYREGKNSAPNDRRAGPGDMIELTFARPVWYGTFDQSALSQTATDHPYKKDANDSPEKIDTEWSATAFKDADDLILLDSPVSPDDTAGQTKHDVGDATSFSANGAILVYIPWEEPDKLIVILADVTQAAENPTVVPGTMYLNWGTSGLLNDRSSDEIPVQPASRPIQLRL